MVRLRRDLRQAFCLGSCLKAYARFLDLASKSGRNTLLRHSLQLDSLGLLREGKLGVCRGLTIRKMTPSVRWQQIHSAAQQRSTCTISTHMRYSSLQWGPTTTVYSHSCPPSAPLSATLGTAASQANLSSQKCQAKTKAQSGASPAAPPRS